MTSATAPAPNSSMPSPPFLQNGGECGALLRAMDWSCHPLGPPEHWPVTLQTTVGIVLGSRQPMLVCWGPEFHTVYNDECAVLCGQLHPGALGTPFSVIWSDSWDVVGPMIARVKTGESIHMDDLGLVLQRNGYAEEAHFSFSYTPIRHPDSSVVGMFCACKEITEQVMFSRDLDHERAKLGQIFEQAPSFIVKLKGPDHVIELANPAYMRLIGHRDVIGKPAAEALPEIAAQGYIDILDSVFTTGETMRTDGAQVALQRSVGSPLETRFVDFAYQPVRDASAKITGVIAAGVDVTERTLALAALKASEQFLWSIISASPDCIKVLQLDGRISFISDGGRLMLEVPQDHVIDGKLWSDFWHEPAKGTVLAALEQAISGEPAQFQAYGDTMGGNRRYWDVRISPMLDAEGRPDRILVVSRDISYLRQIEEERELLMNELSHRLKNAFGMVQSVINQTLRQVATLQDGREILAGRIRALASTQDILTRSIASEMQIDEVVEAALLPHRTGEGRFVIAGPDTMINGRQSLGLSLALHELATNATKYGALSAGIGHVDIGWDVQADGAFRFHWQESGGPVVTAPVRNGFGSVLIEKIVATYFDGSATLNFAPTGVVFRLIGVIAPTNGGEVSDPY